jgi:hypothetical protein
VSAVVTALRADQIDLETASEAGLSAADDDLQIAHVQLTGRVMITGDYRLMHAMVDLTQGQHHPGVLLLPGLRRHEIGNIVS